MIGRAAPLHTLFTDPGSFHIMGLQHPRALLSSIWLKFCHSHVQVPAEEAVRWQRKNLQCHKVPGLSTHILLTALIANSAWSGAVMHGVITIT